MGLARCPTFLWGKCWPLHDSELPAHPQRTLASRVPRVLRAELASVKEDPCPWMASTASALKRTYEGKTLGPIGSERHRQPPPPPHRLGTTGGEVWWPDSLFTPFPGDGPSYRFDGAEFLENVSAAANRGRRRPRAGTWSRLLRILNHPTPGKARLSNDRECAEGDSLPGDDQSADIRGGSFATSATIKLPCRASKGTCLLCRDLSASESAGLDKPALDGSGGRGTRPLLVQLQPTKAFGSKTSGPGKWRTVDGRWGKGR